MLGPYSERLCPLLARHVAGLVGMPYLFAVIAELRLAAVPLAGQLGAAGTAVGDHRITGEERKTPGELVKDKAIRQQSSDPFNSAWPRGGCRRQRCSAQRSWVMKRWRC